jgi:transposase
MFMDDNASPHRARIVQHFLQQEAVQTIPWPAMSPDMNPIEHLWDFIGRKINKRYPKCQNIQKQLCPKCGCPEMKCFVGAKSLHDSR